MLGTAIPEGRCCAVRAVRAVRWLYHGGAGPFSLLPRPSIPFTSASRACSRFLSILFPPLLERILVRSVCRVSPFYSTTCPTHFSPSPPLVGHDSQKEYEHEFRA